LIIMHERALGSSATRQYKAALARSIHAQIDSDRLERWRQALVVPRQGLRVHLMSKVPFWARRCSRA
jgi:hypothetical protein